MNYFFLSIFAIKSDRFTLTHTHTRTSLIIATFSFLVIHFSHLSVSIARLWFENLKGNNGHLCFLFKVRGMFQI